MKWFALLNLAFVLLLASACTQHRITVDPIYATIDINIKIDNRLDEFWAFEEELAEEEEPVEDAKPSSNSGSSADQSIGSSGVQS